MRRWWGLPLVPLYGVGVWGKDVLYRVGALRVRRLGWPVVSVGSLSAGGAGKTPAVLLLAGLLARHGIEVDVLSRGYGRGSGAVEEVDAEGPASRFGDEPVEMARAGLRVFVGAERLAAGRMAEETRCAGGVHLLDDGFQHRRLGRDLDVVLLTAEDVRDGLLPGGNLREPLRALRRADVVVLREEEAEAMRPVVVRQAAEAEVWVVQRELDLPAEMPERPVVFCGIARAEGFFGMLRQRGVEAAGTIAFPDHHAYRREDFERLVGAAGHTGADGFVTTAKDAVKISAEMRGMLEEVGPVCVARLRVSLADEFAAMRRIREATKRT